MANSDRAKSDGSTQAAMRTRRKALRRIREINAIVTSALAGDRPDDAEIWALYAELKGMKKYASRLPYREARAGIFVLQRIHPKSAHSELSTIQAMRAKRGEAEQFGQFCELVDQHLFPDVLTHHSFEGHSFASVEPEPIWREVAKIVGWLKDKGFGSFLNSGTLLGVTRDGSFIGHDDDIDLAVVMNGRSLKTVVPDWHKLRDLLAEEGMLDEKNSIAEILRLRSDTGFTIDLFPAWTSLNRFYVYPHTAGTLETSQVLPVKKCAVTGMPVPQDAAAMLVENYGQTWQVPDRFFTFSWRRAHDRFSDFLEAVKEREQLEMVQNKGLAA